MPINLNVLFIERPTFILTVLLAISFGCSKERKAVTPVEFQIHPDFQLELVAAEPLVFDPVDMEFDEKGRAYVLEMPGYPLHDAESRIILLSDRDSDGRFDHRQVFADQLNMASSIMPYREGLLVAAPPYLIFVKDADGDGVAETRETIMGGFAEGNLQHNFNGLTYGLDNWIYAANGGNSGKPYFLQDTTIKVDMRGDDIRLRIEDLQLQRIGESSGGFELTFDNWGHLFETHNTETLLSLVFEGHYTEGIPVEPSHALTVICDRDENDLFRLYPIGEQATRVNHPEQSGYVSGACGITFYGGGAFPAPFNNQLYLPDVVLNLVHLAILTPDTSTFKTTRLREKVEFLASTDRAFRPVNLTPGPDGSLYLLDMHRDVIEHPEWIPDEIEQQLDLDAGKDKGRIYRISPRGNWKPQSFAGLDRNDPAQLVRQLGHENQWTRMTAQRLLVESNNQDAVPLLEQLYTESKSPLARLHALWTLDGLQALAASLLEKGLKDSSDGVRENAVKIAEKRINQEPQIVETILTMVADEQPRVRLRVLLALSQFNTLQFDRHASTIKENILALLKRQDNDQWLGMAATAAVSRMPVTFSRELLSASMNARAIQVAETLARVVGQNQDLNDIVWYFELLAQRGNLNAKEQALLLEAVSEGLAARRPPAPTADIQRIKTALSRLETSNSALLVRAAAKLRKQFQLPVSPGMKKLIAHAKQAVLKKEGPPEERLEFLQLIALDEFTDREQLLYNLLDNTEPIALQREALQQLWYADQPQVGQELLKKWPTLGPEARKHAGNILLYKSKYHDLLLRALEDGSINLGEMNLDLERRRVLLWSDDEDIKQRATALFSDAGVVQRKEAIEKMKPALALAGDIAKGRTLYTQRCGQCHKYADVGIEVGPALTEINRKSKASLLHDILDPNAAVDTRYINHSITTKDGNIYTGIIQQETDDQITLRSTGGMDHTFQKNDIEQFKSLGISLMPEGQETNMSHEDMADLLAFLLQPTM